MSKARDMAFCDGHQETYPGTACQALQTKLLGDLRRAHGVLPKKKKRCQPREQDLSQVVRGIVLANLAYWRKLKEEHRGVRPH